MTETTIPHNDTINDLDRLTALVAALKGQKQAVVEAEVKIRTFTAQLTKMKLKGGNPQQLLFVGQQVEQVKGVFEATSMAISFTRETLFELFEKNKENTPFVLEWQKHFKLNEKPN